MVFRKKEKREEVREKAELTIREKEPIPDDIEIDEMVEKKAPVEYDLELIAKQIEDLRKMQYQTMQIVMMLNQQNTLALTGQNYISMNQLELGKLFIGEVPEELEMFKVVVKQQHIDELNIKQPKVTKE